METHAAESNEKIAKVGNNEDVVMFVLDAVVDAFESQVQEHEVRQSVDDFGRVSGGIIVLQSVRRKFLCTQKSSILLHTNRASM